MHLEKRHVESILARKLIKCVSGNAFALIFRFGSPYCLAQDWLPRSTPQESNRGYPLHE